MRALTKAMTWLFALTMLLIPSLSLAQSTGEAAKPKEVDTQMALRTLWEGHIFWVRNYVLMTNLGDKAAAQAADAQVVQNAKDIANAIVPFYGKEAGDKLFSLLAAHYGDIKDYMKADFKGNQEAKHKAMESMEKNADQIAAFLSSANPNWPKDAVLAALKTHAGFHMTEIEQIKAKNYTGEAKTWTSMKGEVDQIADTLAQGLAKQFPQKFEAAA